MNFGAIRLLAIDLRAVGFQASGLRIMSVRALMAVCLACVAVPGAAAHPADEGAGVQLSVLATAYRTPSDAAAERFDASVAVYLHNATGEAVTLRGAASPGAGRVRLLQTRRLFGLVVEREAAFIRLDPGESLILEPPDGRVLVEGVPRSALILNGVRLRFDFGPAGMVEALARLPAP